MKSAEIEVLDAIIENTDMGMHSLDVLMSSANVKDLSFKQVLKEHYNDYSTVNTEAAQMLKDSGNEVKKKGAMAKVMSKFGIKMNTLIDSSVSHIADMMIQGSTMGITDITKQMNEKSGNLDKPVSALADKLLHIHQQNIDHMRNYL